MYGAGSWRFGSVCSWEGVKTDKSARRDKTDGLEAAANTLKKSKKEKRLQDWQERALHDQYMTRDKLNK